MARLLLGVLLILLVSSPAWAQPSGGGGGIRASGAPTNHQLPIFTNGTTIKGFGPCASGVFVMGQGSSADPICSTLVMPNSATTGGVAVATSTNTVGFTAVGTSGQVLTSNGSGNAPTFQSVTGTGTVTHTAGNLTNNAVMLGAGTADSKVDTGCSTDGAGAQTCVSYTTNGASNGKVTLGNTTNANTAAIQGGVTTTTYALTLPVADAAGVLHSNGSGTTSLSAVSLTADVSGTAPVANGGTGVASYTKGDILISSGSTTLTKLAVGSDTQVLTADSTQATGVKWAAGGGSGLSGLTTGVIPKAASSSTIANSALDDGVTTANTLSYSGSAGLALTGGTATLITATAGTAPSTPASGKGAVYVDSTSKNLAVKDDAGVVKHGIQTDTGASNNFLTAVSDAGLITKAQPTWANLAAGTGTNLTLDAEGTGNVISIPIKKWLPAAGCNNATAGTVWDLPASTPAVPTCVTGTNIQKGVLAFADTSGGFSAQITEALPVDWTTTGGVDVVLYWTTSATTGNAKWSVSTICTDVAASATDDPAFNTANTVTTAAPGTANRVQTSAIASLTLTSCTTATKMLLHLKVFRDGNDGSDTIGATANLIGVELTFRRAM